MKTTLLPKPLKRSPSFLKESSTLLPCLFKRLNPTSIFLIVILAMAYPAKAQFVAGNLVVLRTEESDSNTPASIVEVNPTTAGAVSTVAIPSDGTGLRFSGSASSTGYLSNNNDGSLVCFTGVTTTDTGSTNTNAILARNVGTYNQAKTFNKPAAYTGTNGNQPRSATTINNANYFIADQNGLYTNGSTSVSPSGNFRGIKAFGGMVYVFTASTVPSVGTISAPSAGTYTPLPGLPNGTSAMQDFYMISSGSNGSAFDVLYLLSTINGGTIYKYSLVSGTWVSNGTATANGFGLAAKKQGNGAYLFVTTGSGATTANSLVRYTDSTGYNATISLGSGTTLYTASGTQIIKGVAFAPVAVSPISTTGTLSAVSTTYGTASGATSYNVSATGVTSNVVITPPAGFEVSTTSGTSGFAATQTLTQSGGNVASTTVYFRLKADAPSGSYSGNIVFSSTGSVSLNSTIPTGTVNPKALTVNSAAAQNKSYDGGFSAVITGTLNGIINSDVVFLSGGGTFLTKDVATAISVTAALGLTGANASNYILTQPAGLSADITAKELTFSGVSVSDKEYDGTTTAAFTGILVGVVGSEDVVLNTVANFDFPFVGTEIPVVVSAEISGMDAFNYTITSPEGLSADISQKGLIILNATADNKVYDGTTDATISGTLSGVIAPDEVFLSATGTFASPEVGVGIAVTSTSEITGDVFNYYLIQPTGLTANISADELVGQVITFNSLSPVTYGDDSFTLNATADSGLTVSFASSNESVATVSGATVTIVGPGTTQITATQSGDLTYDSAEPISRELNVLQKELFITGVLAADKIYNASSATTISGTLSGVIGSDTVAFTANASFTSVNVGTEIPVTSNAVLTGADAAKYTLAQPEGLVADITPIALTLAGLSAEDKTYDATNSVILSGGALVGIINSDDVSFTVTGIFGSADAAIDSTVYVTVELTGSGAGNYSVDPVSLSADITPLALTVTGLSAQDKVYNGNNTALVTGTPQVTPIGSDEVTVSGIAAATFDNKNVGIAKPISISGLVLSGDQAANYTIAVSLSANITAAPVTVNGAVAQDKAFDGTTSATITGTLSGVIVPDVLTLIGTGAFESSAVGTNIPVTANVTLTGAGASNYMVTPQPSGLSANILDGPTVFAVGDLSIIGFQVNAPDTFAWVPWIDVKPNTIVKFTDNGFNAAGSANTAGNARATEDWVIWKNNGALIPAGTVITLQDNGGALTSSGQIVSGNLSGLSSSGDQVFAYQGAAVSGSNPDYLGTTASATFNGNLVFGLNIQGSSSSASWLTSGTASSNLSYLPTQLGVANGSVALGTSASRGQYTGSRNSQTSFAAYKALVTNPANWTTSSGTGTTTLSTVAFTLATPPSLAQISGSVGICAGGSTNLSVAVTGGTAPFSVVYSNGTSQFTVSNYQSGNAIVVAPAGTTSYSLVSVTDANALIAVAISGTAVVTVQNLYSFFIDSDFDTYGSTTTAMACAANGSTPPAGYSVNNTDCNDAVAAINPGHAEVNYNGIDDNCDGNLDEGNQLLTSVTASQCGVTLSAINSLIQVTGVANTTMYRYQVYKVVGGVETGTPLYVERAQPYFTFTNMSSYDYATTYSIRVELQRNGTWLGYYGPACQVSTPALLDNPSGAGSINPSQCGIQLATISTLIATPSLQSVTGYKFRVTNVTDPLAPGQVQEITRSQQYFALTMLPYYFYGTTYNVEVAVRTNGVFSGYGAPCPITSPAVPMILNCDQHMAQPVNYIYTNSLNKVVSYRFEVSLVDANDNPVSTQIVDRTLHYFNFNMVPNYVPGGKYMVRVALRTTGYHSPFGEACFVYAPTSLRHDGTLKAEELQSRLDATVFPNPYAESFALDLDSTSDEPVQIRVYDMIGKLLEERSFQASQIELAQFGEKYPSGVYNIVLSQGVDVKTLRVIKR